MQNIPHHHPDTECPDECRHHRLAPQPPAKRSQGMPAGQHAGDEQRHGIRQRYDQGLQDGALFVVEVGLQLAHLVNARSISSPSPITRKVADALEDIRKALNANRTVNANIWKRVREHFTTKQ